MKFFYLQKSDRNTILLLLCIIVAAIAVIQLTDSEKPSEGIEQATTDKKQKNASAKSPKTYTYSQGEPTQAELFPFDPNDADSTQLLRLGLKPWQVHNINKYRANGGIFRQPSDFARLYGLTRKQYQQLAPFIRIKEENMPANRHFYNYEPIEKRDTVRYPIKLQPDERIVLNRADTAQLRKVPGIGPYFARKIVEYRNRLGGYYRVQQLLEIEDFPESALTFFVIPDDTKFHKINLNRLSLNELKRHPYINYYQARAIVDYRRLHGPLESLQQLSLLPDFPSEAIQRLEPYVEF